MENSLKQKPKIFYLGIFSIILIGILLARRIFGKYWIWPVGIVQIILSVYGIVYCMMRKPAVGFGEFRNILMCIVGFLSAVLFILLAVL